MKERIIEFLRAENKSSAQFALEIGVQPSGISHILSGRNKPSLDFILKMLEKYRYISTEWLLFGKGTMYKDSGIQSLFDENRNIENHNDLFNPSFSSTQEIIEETGNKSVTTNNSGNIIRIVWFYDDNSFEEYLPRS